MKQILFIFLLACSNNSVADWLEYSTKSNGDVYFYDAARVQKNTDQIQVWNRIRYKTSVMAASSFQSLLKIDCSNRTETVLQSTFYTDRDWSKPAMATNTNPKPKTKIMANSTSEKLFKILCKDS